MELGATYKTAKPPTSQGSGKAKAYGAVVIDADGRVLLREPTDHYDEYVWTFAKGRPNLGETPEETARREVKEETGIAGTIVVPIPGEFEGGTTVNLFFLASPVGEPGPWGKETAQIRWVTEEEAKDLIGKTTNKTGRPRDLAILKAAFAVYLGQPSKS
ncbi:MAG: NUDIX hydrolase [Chloroflexi bacterium]|nr:NUDIX hydrolase [Chloroflexota bacterium]